MSSVLKLRNNEEWNSNVNISMVSANQVVQLKCREK